MIKKININIPIIVEGIYDKEKLLKVVDAFIITTDGFGVFNSDEKKKLIRAVSKDGIIVLTDSDGAGKVIRSEIKSIVEGANIFNMYTKQIKGKEKRKDKPSKEGFLGVEGIDENDLYDLFSEFIGNNELKKSGKYEELKKADLYADGFLGGDNSSKKRNELAKAYDLPKDMTPTAFLEALNMLGGREKYESVKKYDGYKNT